MECEFFLQDPTSPDTVYLFEAMIAASQDAVAWTGMFAFASRAGVDALVTDPVTQSFLRDSRMSLLVGMDAVTNRGTLERLQALERQHARLSVRVFWNRTPGLFHPKIARFDYPNGSRSLIVGSGNLTPGGLRQNFEAFSVMRASANETLDVSSWERFLTDHAEDIRAIDEEALERAARNTIRGGGERRIPQLDVEPDPVGRAVGNDGRPAIAGAEVELPVGGTERFLIAQVPEAGGRWHQLHLNKDVVERYFRVQPNTSQRAYLVECMLDGSFGDQEVRPCVYSQANKNHKIEIASHRGDPYPAGGPPIAVFRELQARSFAYMLLMPGDRGYAELSRLNAEHEAIGRGHRRIVTDLASVRDAWPQCPLITAIDALAVPANGG
jgi:hypothetical protein